VIKKSIIFLIILLILLTSNANIFAATSSNYSITGVHAYGSTGYEIERLYDVLWDLGFNLNSSSYGYFDEKVESAIRAIQKYHGLETDGILGYNTKDVINYLLKINNSTMRKILYKYQSQYIIRKSNASLNGKTLFRNSRNIYFKGTVHTNVSDRNGVIPRIIVDHITGTNNFYSTHQWFTKSYNDVSSAHFVVDRDGTIYQYVLITKAAWANGIKNGMLKYASSDYVKKLGYNANRYTISIEHVGTNGYLKDSQLDASIWLHKYIRDFVRTKYGYTIPLNRTHVIGHYEIDPINKYFCPGPKFPWDSLMKGLKN
jgi:N-acetyl-anhydromuramyl-L-alanine amidase AmpD